MHIRPKRVIGVGGEYCNHREEWKVLAWNGIIRAKISTDINEKAKN